MSVSQWSTTPSSNASGVTNVNWAEGQAPSTVNDSARNMMADVAGWLGQASGAIPEYLTGVAGTNTVTATGPSQMAGYVAGQRFMFLPAATNTGATTLNITPSGGAALGAKNVFWNGAACVGGEMRISVPATVIYDGTQFHILATAFNVPLTQNSQSVAYTTVLTDAGKHILHPTADNNPRTFTIDSNANVAYPIGTTLTFVNQINTVTLAITSDTLTMAGTGSTGSRTLAASGMATALKIASTSWIISGTGLS